MARRPAFVELNGRRVAWSEVTAARRAAVEAAKALKTKTAGPVAQEPAGRLRCGTYGASTLTGVCARSVPPDQPALFEMRHVLRAAEPRTAASRYAQPGLFDR